MSGHGSLSVVHGLHACIPKSVRQSPNPKCDSAGVGLPRGDCVQVMRSGGWGPYQVSALTQRDQSFLALSLLPLPSPPSPPLSPLSPPCSLSPPLPSLFPSLPSLSSLWPLFSLCHVRTTGRRRPSANQYGSWDAIWNVRTMVLIMIEEKDLSQDR
ncbi:hypothetical protein HJG60_009861 [Phyllostomus discolor]|uniref:Uncharacterized protein n=1 Tax=Phyllostomus discolor TaxID=89673 RepID=A0A834B2P7_9CHIR|nr:hypothetical protein HJG60_009861 [Phyllostomus discolor]